MYRSASFMSLSNISISYSRHFDSKTRMCFCVLAFTTSTGACSNVDRWESISVICVKSLISVWARALWRLSMNAVVCWKGESTQTVVFSCFIHSLINSFPLCWITWVFKIKPSCQPVKFWASDVTALGVFKVGKLTAYVVVVNEWGFYMGHIIARGDLVKYEISEVRSIVHGDV